MKKRGEQDRHAHRLRLPLGPPRRRSRRRHRSSSATPSAWSSSATTPPSPSRWTRCSTTRRPSSAAPKRAHVVADMPFMSYQVNAEDALRNAGRLLKEGGAQSVKLEGGVQVAETVRRIVDAGIPVMGHIGLTPQSINQLGGYKVQGKTPDSRRRAHQRRHGPRAGRRLRHRARMRARASSRDAITERLAHPDDRHRRRPGLRRPGAGLPRPARPLPGVPPEARASATPTSATRSRDAVRAYADDVRAGRFPTEAESFIMDTPLFTEPSEATSAKAPTSPPPPDRLRADLLDMLLSLVLRCSSGRARRQRFRDPQSTPRRDEHRHHRRPQCRPPATR